MSHGAKDFTFVYGMRSSFIWQTTNSFWADGNPGLSSHLLTNNAKVFRLGGASLWQNSRAFYSKALIDSAMLSY